jgi:transposase-like protein
MGESRKQWSGEAILGVLRRHLVDRVDISKVCEEAGVHPSQLYRWQAQLFGSGGGVPKLGGKSPAGQLHGNASSTFVKLP